MLHFSMFYRTHMNNSFNILDSFNTWCYSYLKILSWSVAYEDRIILSVTLKQVNWTTNCDFRKVLGILHHNGALNDEDLNHIHSGKSFSLISKESLCFTRRWFCNLMQSLKSSQFFTRKSMWTLRISGLLER